MSRQGYTCCLCWLCRALCLLPSEGIQSPSCLNSLPKGHRWPTHHSGVHPHQVPANTASVFPVLLFHEAQQWLNSVTWTQACGVTSVASRSSARAGEQDAEGPGSAYNALKFPHSSQVTLTHVFNAHIELSSIIFAEDGEGKRKKKKKKHITLYIS